MHEIKNILVTGPPGIGKTTLIRKLSDELRNLQPVGFYTAEIREKGIRKGFELVTLDGRRGLLSHVDIKGPYRVGKYGVDVLGFENLIECIPFFGPGAGLIIIDELGQMECFSAKFRALAEQILESEKPLIATIALKGGGFIAEVKKRENIRLYALTHANRDTMVNEIADAARGLLQ